MRISQMEASTDYHILQAFLAMKFNKNVSALAHETKIKGSTYLKDYGEFNQVLADFFALMNWTSFP